MNSLQEEIEDSKKKIKKYENLLEKEDCLELKKYGVNKEASMEWLRQQLTPLQEQLAILMKRQEREEAGQQGNLITTRL